MFDIGEAQRYAAETMNLSYTAFGARKADFEAEDCNPEAQARGLLPEAVAVRPIQLD